MFDRFKPIFELFNNLNLLTLMANLRFGWVAKKVWITSWGDMCPISHGMPNGAVIKKIEKADCEDVFDYVAEHLAVGISQVSAFVKEWDYGGYLEPGLLLTCLELIWKERLDDAEAVQKVLENESVLVEA